MTAFPDLAVGLGVGDRELFLCTQEGRRVSIRELEAVCRIEDGAGTVELYLAGEDAPLRARGVRLADLQRLLPTRFIMHHGDRLVDRERIEAVSGAPARFRLHLRGSDRVVEVTGTYEGQVAEALGVSTLERLVSEHTEDQRLRELGLLDFGAREVGRLDLADPEAVQEFKLRWDLKLWNTEDLLRYFGQVTHPSEYDEKKLVRNIIWQHYRWMEWGIQERWNSALRQFWYMVEKVFENQTDVEVEVKAGQYNAILNEMVRDQAIFTYRQFGFFDVRSRFRDIGKEHPRILLVDEKEGNYLELVRAVPDLRYTIACTKGQPALIMLDYLPEELSKAGVDLGTTEFHVFTIMDLDPAGRFIQSSLVESLRQRGMENLHHYSLVRGDHLEEHFPVPILLEKARAVLAQYTERDGGRRRVPYSDTEADALEEAWTFFERLGCPEALRTVREENGRQVYTLWKISAGSYNRSLINQEFLAAAARIIAGEPVGVPEESSWQEVLGPETLLRWRPDLDLDEAGF